MKIIKLRYPKREDLVHVFKNMREIDKKEFIDLAGENLKLKDMKELVKISQLRLTAIGENNKAVCIFGCTSEGVIWLFGTNELFKCRKDILKYSKMFITKWLKRFGKLHNVILKDNHRSFLLLKALGFSFDNMNGSDFLYFYKG